MVYLKVNNIVLIYKQNKPRMGATFKNEIYYIEQRPTNEKKSVSSQNKISPQT